MTETSLITRVALAEKLHLSPRTILRLEKTGIPHVKVSPRTTLYDYRKVLAYLKKLYGKEGT